MIPVAKAMEIILMAQRIDATQEALRLGLVNRVVPAAGGHAHGPEDG